MGGHMYICLCKKITEKDLKEGLGSRPGISIKDICRKLGVGSDCGSCLYGPSGVLEKAQGIEEKSKKPQR